MGVNPDYSIAQFGGVLNQGPTTIQKGFDNYRTQGLEGVLNRDTQIVHYLLKCPSQLELDQWA